MTSLIKFTWITKVLIVCQSAATKLTLIEKRYYSHQCQNGCNGSPADVLFVM